MKSLATAVALVAVFAIAGSAKAAEPVKGQISETQLSALGFEGMVTLSDAQGAEIRGQGRRHRGSNVTLLDVDFHQVNIGNGQVNNFFIGVNFGGIRVGGRNRG
jgi:hypothetical protein